MSANAVHRSFSLSEICIYHLGQMQGQMSPLFYLLSFAGEKNDAPGIIIGVTDMANCRSDRSIHFEFRLIVETYITFFAGFPAYPKPDIPISVVTLDDFDRFDFTGTWPERGQFSFEDCRTIQC